MALASTINQKLSYSRKSKKGGQAARWLVFMVFLAGTFLLTQGVTVSMQKIAIIHRANKLSSQEVTVLQESLQAKQSELEFLQSIYGQELLIRSSLPVQKEGETTVIISE